MRSAVAAVMLVVLVALSTACSGEPEQKEVTGVITTVDLTSLTDLEGFSLRSNDETFEFVVTDATRIDFPPAHLNEHRVSGDPLTVTYEEENDELVALSIEDA